MTPVLFCLAFGFALGWCAAMLAIALAVDGIWPFKRRGWQDMTVIDHKRRAWGGYQPIAQEQGAPPRGGSAVVWLKRK